jgi:pantetheine-phosphate adenylyltransferase
MGGTFDHLHEGHKYLVKTALELSKKVVIGLTIQALHKKKKFSSKIQDFNTRKENLETFIASITDPRRVEIVPLSDHFGPPIHEPEYEAIITSEETYNGALRINQIRIEKGFAPLIIIVIPMVKDSNNHIISSTSIRASLK